MSKKDVTGGDNLSQNAFGGLNLSGLPEAPAKSSSQISPVKPAKLQKIHARIEKSGRSGKIVTVLFGPGLAVLDEGGREALLKSLKNSLGCGGAVVEGVLELQGDVRERAAAALVAKGYPAK